MENAIDLKIIRENRNISRSELADELGVDTSTICRWELNGIPERGASRKAIERWIASSAEKAA